jgi:Zn-dependent protease
MSPASFHAFFPASTGGETASARRSNGWFHAALLVFTLAVCWLLRSYGPAKLGTFVRPPAITSFSDLGILLAAVVAAMVLHECGHLLAAWLLGFKFSGASLGPWRLQRLHGQSKLTFSTHRMMDASVSAMPAKLENWRRNLLAVVAAGPLFTLASAAGAFYLLQLADSHYRLAVLFLAFLLQVNALLFVLGLIPNSVGARVLNDARLFLILAENGHSAEELRLTVELALLVNEGARPQDYPAELMLRLARWRGRPEAELHFANALVRWAMDRDEPVLAECWDAQALAISELCDWRLRNQALAASACVDVLFRDDFEAARSKFTQVNTRMLFPKCLEYRARAACQIAMGRSHKAAREILRAQYSLPRGVVAYDLERKLLENLHLRVLAVSQRAQNALRASC